MRRAGAGPCYGSEMRNSTPVLGLAALLIVASDLACGPGEQGPVTDADPEPEPEPEPEPDLPSACPGGLAEQVDGAAMIEHLNALAGHADAAGGSRVAGRAGYGASADYAAATLSAAGYAVTRQPFMFTDFEVLAAPLLRQVAPEVINYEEDVEFRVAFFSGSGAVKGPLVAIAPSLGAGNKSASGCDPGDFLGIGAGSVALIQRGSCTYAAKIANAVAAGAAAAVIFNQGDTPARSGIFTPMLAEDTPIPVLGVSYAIGEAWVELAAEATIEVELSVSAIAISRATENILAEKTGEDPSARAVMIGAHLDSVAAGPGINDNGSGSAAVLELARQAARCGTPGRLRFALWGAEELGLLGSRYYVEALTSEEREAIAMYVNLDMIASPNPVRFIYDGDGSGFGAAGPAGSAEIEAAFAEYFADLGLPSKETPFNGRSDYGPFIEREIPAGGLFTGAEGVKGAEEAGLFGGEADAPYDACYHAACDGIANFNEAALLENTRAAASVIERFAETPLTRASRSSEGRSWRPQRRTHDEHESGCGSLADSIE